MPEVSYRPITGFPGYRVGDDGTVWSCRLRGAAATARRGLVDGTGEGWRQLKPVPGGPDDYLVVTLCRERKHFNRGVHVLVLLAFVGPCPDGMEACHEDGDPANNRLDNLRWDTPMNNAADRERHGRTSRGEHRPLAKLTAALVRSIRVERAGGRTTRELAGKYHVSQSLVRQVVRGAIWGHVGAE